MPAEIIITSVPRGLDGGSGFQTVKRTREMPLAVSERLHQRSGYTHRFAAGDKRNPVIISHQIEKLKAGVFHVLGLIKDAGTDHSGRQNRLAHLIAFDETDVHGNQAGPASVAKQLRDSRLLIDSWDQQPHEAEPLAIPSFNAEPRICQAWIDAGLDPGVAGELAEAAATGKKSVLIVPASTDVIALFADAMLLMPPASRWKTTFTTCGSGSEDYVWQAVRADLAEANDARKLPGVIDLTQAYSGKDSPYASFAKTGKGQLPWQQSASVVPDVETDSAPPIGSQVPPSSTQVTPPLHSQEVTNASGSTTAPQLDSSNAMQGQGSQPKKRRLSELSSVPAKAPPTPVQTSLLRNAAMVVASSLFLALIVLAAIYVQEISYFGSRCFELFTQESTDNKQIAGHESPKETIDLTRPKVVIKPQDEIKKDQGEEDQRGQNWIEAEDEFLELVDRWWADYQEARRADLASRKEEAFAQFKALPEAASICSGVDPNLSDIQIFPVEIGSVQWDLLVSPKMSLATPEDFSAQVKELNIDSGADDGIKRMWSITVKGASVGDSSGVSLVEVYVDSSDIDGEPDCLRMRPTERFKQETNDRDRQNLLRSLLLLTAKNPENGKTQTHSIQFFKPLPGSQEYVDFFKRGLTDIEVKFPTEIEPIRDSDKLEITVAILSPCNKSGEPEPTTLDETFDAGRKPTFDSRKNFILVKTSQAARNAVYVFQSLVEYYFEKNVSKLRFKYKHQKKPVGNNQFAEWGEREVRRTDFEEVYGTEESFKTKRTKYLNDIQDDINTIKRMAEKHIENPKRFDAMANTIRRIFKNSETGWLVSFKEVAMQENKEEQERVERENKEKEEKEGGGQEKKQAKRKFETLDEWFDDIAKARDPKDAKEVFEDGLDRLFEFYKPWFIAFTDERRKEFSLVEDPAKIFIARGVIFAYGRDGTEYPVVLIDQDAQSLKGSSSNDRKGASLN